MREQRSETVRKTYACERCGARIPLDRSQCRSCRHWNVKDAPLNGNDGTVLLSEMGDVQELKRIVSGPWDPCFGGGIDVTSTTLIGGEPGAGKSTIATQILDAVCGVTQRIGLYIAAEENLKQINYRTTRLHVTNRNLIRMLPMNHIDRNIGQIITARKPCMTAIDSLSKLVRNDPTAAVELCARVKDYATELESPFLIIDHVTKDGDFAGFEDLQHEVDATMMYTVYDDGVRLLQTIKNRSGRGMVKCYFDMTERGLVPLSECRQCGQVKCDHIPEE